MNTDDRAQVSKEQTMIQEPKYVFGNGHVINRASGEIIPLDEPVFILRGRDVHAAQAISDYAANLPNDEHRAAVVQRYAQFRDFAREHPGRMKEPDTDASGPEWQP